MSRRFDGETVRTWLRRGGAAAKEHWRRAEERVDARRVTVRQMDLPEQGRLGGETAAATLPAAPRPQNPAWREELNANVEQQRRKELQGLPGIAKRVFAEFGQDNGTLMAASLAFYILLSLVPVVLVAISLLGMVLGKSADAQRHVIQFVHNYVPIKLQSGIIESAVSSVIGKRGVIGGFGLIGLLLSASSGFETLETAINLAWNTPKRGFLMSKLFALGMMLLIGVLLVVSLAVTGIATWAGKLSMFSWLGAHHVLQTLLGLVPILVSAVMFTLIYKLFPNVKSGWKPALLAGGVTAVLWEAFKWGYVFYATHLMHNDATYGTLSGIVGLVLWIYYSAALVLLGSELAWVLEGCPGEKHPQNLKAG